MAFTSRTLTRMHHPTLTTGDLAAAAEMLERAELSRREQLAALATPGDAVARAHRTTVQRILDEICLARTQLADGSYGTCARCRATLDGADLRGRPWSIWCPGCVRR